jgi:hypothetical protein
MKKLFTLLFAFACISIGIAQAPVDQDYQNNAPGNTTPTYTINAGVTTDLTVQVWAGGGGSTGGASGARCGGGGGGYASYTYTGLVGPLTITMQVGGQGTAGISGGGNSFVQITGFTDVSANGGSRGLASAPGTGGGASGPAGGTYNSGGTGGNRTVNSAGGGGGGAAGTSGGGGTGGDAIGGTGGLAGNGATGGGNGGAGQNSGGAAANGGVFPGGGAGGLGDGGNGTGGIGAGGRIILDFFNTVLPIELTTFSAKPQSGSVLLVWQTASELNNDYMAVERSVDGIKFSEIGRVSGKGTTYNPQNYQLEDRNPLSGVNYYRLRQVDFDGSFSFSKVVSATVDVAARAGELTLYPTVVKSGESINIQLPGISIPEVQLRVYNSKGQLLSTTEVSTEGHISLPVQALPEGIYYISTAGLSQNWSGRFIVKN